MAAQTPSVRRFGGSLPILRGITFALLMVAALVAMPFYPVPLVWLIAIVCGVAAVFVPIAAVIVFVVALFLPLAAVNLFVAAIVLLAGVATCALLAEHDGTVFLVIALAVAATAVRAEWVLPIIAGYLLGVTEGASTAVAACVVIELIGLALGRPVLGVTVTGGAVNVMGSLLARGPVNPLAFAWVRGAVAHVWPSVTSTVGSAMRTKYLVLLIAQPALWGVAAALVGAARDQVLAGERSRVVFGPLLAAAGAVALGAASGVLLTVMGAPVPAQLLTIASLEACVLAAIWALVWEGVFKAVPPVAPVVPDAAAAATGVMARQAVEEADVDDLLRTIAQTEQQLARHYVHATILISDVQGFSTLTHQDGSLESARAIQEQRDLLLPVVEYYGGSGKSAGGDGLLATFGGPAPAVAAAVDMQRVLAARNQGPHAGRALLVRIGLAEGEVVVDRDGRPFIGDALNVAARVMSLARGGQIYVADAVCDAATTPTAYFGAFDLKNIAEPVRVSEVLWAEGQQPMPPEVAGAKGRATPQAAQDVVEVAPCAPEPATASGTGMDPAAPPSEPAPDPAAGAGTGPAPSAPPAGPASAAPAAGPAPPAQPPEPPRPDPGS